MACLQVRDIPGRYRAERESICLYSRSSGGRIQIENIISPGGKSRVDGLAVWKTPLPVRIAEIKRRSGTVRSRVNLAPGAACNLGFAPL